MKFAVDGRYIGKSGIGRVCEGILDALDFGAHEFYLIGDREKLAKYADRGARIVEDATEPYSLAGLRSFDRSLNKVCNAYFTPNFLIPFGIKIPVHAVMHDLAFLDVPETTGGFFDKFVKKTLLKRCMKRAATIACVSEFTKRRCEFYYGKLAKKCYVAYNGLSEKLYGYAAARPDAEKQNKIVFVGNVKPHKGLSELLAAFGEMQGGDVLKIIGERENFRKGMDLDDGAYENVEFTGRMNDEELFAEIAGAKYLVLPSKYEGFGFPPLEALLLGTQPIVRDIEVFREVYAGLPVKYFQTRAELCAALAEAPLTFNREKTAEAIQAKYSFQRQAAAVLERMERGK